MTMDKSGGDNVTETKTAGFDIHLNDNWLSTGLYSNDERVAATAAEHPVERVYPVELIDKDGVVHAVVEKTVYIRRKDGGGADGANHGQAT